MGTPNNPQPRTAEEVLRDLVCKPSHGLTETDAHALGLDVDLAETTFQSNVKPYLDYLTGYKPLTIQQPVGSAWYDAQWGELLSRSLLNQSGGDQTILVIRDRLYDTLVGNRFEQETGDRFVAVFLSRQGNWYFWWADYKRPIEFHNDHISHHTNLRSLCAAIEQATPERYEFALEGTGGSARYAPLHIDWGLRRILQETIVEREKRLSTMTRSLAEAGERANTIAIGR